MKVLILLTLFLINFTEIKAANCEIHDLSDWKWSSTLRRLEAIEDIHNGLIENYTTKNIVELAAQSSKYMKAEYKNEVLTISTTEKFKDFEKEYDGSSEIDILMTFRCVEGEKELKLYQKVTDTNNHDPVLSQEVYEYHFGMPLPEDYDLTKFLPISASDIDFTNYYINFQIDYSNDVIIRYSGQSDYDNVDYYTSFKTLREIKGPFKQEYTLTAIDGGEPSRNTTARLILTVTPNNSNGENGNGNEGNTSSHPPVFAQHLYFAAYSSDHKLEMDDVITIKHGAEESTTIKQSGYQEYFQASLSNPKTGAVEVKTLKPLPKYILETTDLLIIEIEVENADFHHMLGRTALIVRLPPNQKQDPNDKSQNCNISHSINFQHSDSLVLVLFFISVLIIIVIINVAVLVWYFQRRHLIQHAAYNNNIAVRVDDVKQEKQPYQF